MPAAFAEACSPGHSILVPRSPSGEATELKLLLHTLGFPPRPCGPSSAGLKGNPAGSRSVARRDWPPSSEIPLQGDVPKRAGDCRAESDWRTNPSRQSPRPSLASAQGTVFGCASPAHQTDVPPCRPSWRCGPAGATFRPHAGDQARRRALGASPRRAPLRFPRHPRCWFSSGRGALPVAAVWFRPATLLIQSQPAGAEVVLDGTRLPTPTPANRRSGEKRFWLVHSLRLCARMASCRSRHAIRYDVRSISHSRLRLDPGPQPAAIPAPNP